MNVYVEVAADGVAALNKAMNTHYDLILMDIGLGDGLDGFEVTLQIKQQNTINKNTPIMAVTSHNEPAFQERAKECGMVGYFNKPFTEEEAKVLLEAMKKLPE